MTGGRLRDGKPWRAEAIPEVFPCGMRYVGLGDMGWDVCEWLGDQSGWVAGFMDQGCIAGLSARDGLLSQSWIQAWVPTWRPWRMR